MNFGNKLECAKYLKEKYNVTFLDLLKYKSKEKEYTAEMLNIIKEEYNIFFKEVASNIDLEYTDINMQKNIKKFEMLLDIFYGSPKQMLKIYIDVFKSKEYILLLSKIHKDLPNYLALSITYYLNK
ncbi:MAG: hypothetical protein RR922_04640 [Clostridia bacterium]